MSAKMALHFTAAVLVVFLSNGICEAKSIVRQDVPSGCPKFSSDFMTICSIGPYWCASTADCKDGRICCPRGCGNECVVPEGVETKSGTEEVEPVEERTPPPAVEEEQPAPVSDPCNLLFSIMIYCPVTVDRCETHDECGDGRVCCPVSNCGRRCQQAPDA